MPSKPPVRPHVTFSEQSIKILPRRTATSLTVGSDFDSGDEADVSAPTTPAPTAATKEDEVEILFEETSRDSDDSTRNYREATVEEAKDVDDLTESSESSDEESVEESREYTNTSGLDITFADSDVEVSHGVNISFGEDSVDPPDPPKRSKPRQQSDTSIEELIRSIKGTDLSSDSDGYFSPSHHDDTDTIELLSRIENPQTTSEHSNLLLTSLIEFYIKSRNPKASGSEHRARLRTVLGNLARVGVTEDLTHLARADNDAARGNYFAGLERLASSEHLYPPHDTIPKIDTPGAVSLRASPAAFPPIGNTVGGPHGNLLRYVRVVGKGGQGKVWQVKHILDDQDYALKMIKLPALLDGRGYENDTRLAKVLNEMKILAALDHPNIVRYYYCWIGHNSWIPQGIRTPAHEKDDSEFMDSYTFDDESRITTLSTTEERSQRWSVADTRGTLIRQSSSAPEPTHTLYIVMSLAPLSLSDHLLPSSSPSSPSSAHPTHCFHPLASLQLFLDILAGVSYLHSKQLIHRDLKPANIFLHPAASPSSGCCENHTPLSPRIGDFGLATVVDIDAKGPRVGTSFYTPPERGTHEGVDVWALGVVFLELMYRFGTGSERAMVLNKLVGKREFPGDCPDRVREIVTGCLEKDMASRWDLERLRSVCAEWKRELEMMRDGGGSDEAVWAAGPGGAGSDG